MKKNVEILKLIATSGISALAGIQYQKFNDHAKQDFLKWFSGIKMTNEEQNIVNNLMSNDEIRKSFKKFMKDEDSEKINEDLVKTAEEKIKNFKENVRFELSQIELFCYFNRQKNNLNKFIVLNPEREIEKYFTTSHNVTESDVDLIRTNLEQIYNVMDLKYTPIESAVIYLQKIADRNNVEFSQALNSIFVDLNEKGGQIILLKLLDFLKYLEQQSYNMKVQLIDQYNRNPIKTIEFLIEGLNQNTYRETNIYLLDKINGC